MQAVINICDEGVRLRPLSCVKNGALINIGNLTILEHMLRLLDKGGIEKVTIICTYMPEGVQSCVGFAENLEMKVEIATQGEAGDILTRCAKDIGEDFVYMSRAVYADFDIAEATRLHKKEKAFITIVAPCGISDGLMSDKSGRVTRIEEKRIWASVAGENGGGIYVLNASAVEYMTNGEFTKARLGDAVRGGKSIFVREMQGVYENVWDSASYMRACFAFLEAFKKSDTGGISVAEGASVEKGALLEAPCYVGKGAHVHKGAKVGAYSLIGEGCVIGEGANIKRSIISKDCRIGANSALRGCILDEEVHLGRGSTVYEQAIIGRRTNIGADVLVKSFVKIWPEKTIEKGVIVSENIMWGQKKRSKLFEDGRIKGVVNVDITPLFCTLLGTIAGRWFNSGEVGISTDDSASGAMLRDAIASGLQGSGCHVKDFGEQPLPITRRAVAFYSLQGAVCVSVHSSFGEEVAEISIIGKNGFDIDAEVQQRLEESFEKGEVVYPEAKNIKECEYVFEYKLYYLKSIVDYKKENRKAMKVLLSAPATWGRRLIGSAMADFGSLVSVFEGDCESKEGQKEFAAAVLSGGFDIGFMMDNKCEKLYVAANGQIISDDMYEAMCALVVMKKYQGARIYVPATSSSVIEGLAEKYNCSVIRTKRAHSTLMRCMEGGEKYLSEQLIFKFDAVGSVILLMDFLSGRRLGLTELLDEIPAITMKKMEIEFPEGAVTDVLDKIYHMPLASEAVEGVKITFDKGWVVVIPEMEKEVFTVVSEAVSMEAAKELCEVCVRQCGMRSAECGMSAGATEGK